jgi:hypothetical protein
MTPGRPPPPCHKCAQSLRRPDQCSANCEARARNWISSRNLRTGFAQIRSHRGGDFCRRAHCCGEQPGRERPHLRNADPDPSGCHGVAHVPAACLRSHGGLRMPMSRRVKSGSDRKCTRQSGAQVVTIRGESPLQMGRRCHRRSDLTSLLLVAHRLLGHRAPIVKRCSAASTLSAALRPCVQHGLRCVDAACAPPESANTRWSRFRSP